MIDQLQTKVMTLENKLSDLENQIDDVDQYERRNTIIVSGSSLPKKLKMKTQLKYLLVPSRMI